MVFSGVNDPIICKQDWEKYRLYLQKADGFRGTKSGLIIQKLFEDRVCEKISDERYFIIVHQTEKNENGSFQIVEIHCKGVGVLN